MGGETLCSPERFTRLKRYEQGQQRTPGIAGTARKSASFFVVELKPLSAFEVRDSLRLAAYGFYI